MRLAAIEAQPRRAVSRRPRLSIPARPALRCRHGPVRRAGPEAQEHGVQCDLQPRRPDAPDRLDRQHGPALGRPRRRAPGPAARPPPHRQSRRVRARWAIAGHSGRRTGPPLGTSRRTGVPMSRVPLDGKDSFAALSPDGALTDPDGMSYREPEHAPSTRAYPRRDRPAGRAAPPTRGRDRRCGLLARRAIGRHARRSRGIIDRGAGGRGLGLVERPTGMAGGTALRAPEPFVPPRRPPPRRALRRRGAADLRPRRRPRDPPLGGPRRRARSPLGQQRQGRLQPRRPERADLGDGK